LTVGLTALVASVALNALLVPRLGIDGAAIATAASMAIGAIAGGGYLLMKFGMLLPLKSVARIAVSASALYAASAFIVVTSKVLILLQIALLPLVYIGMLIATGELNRTDLARVKSVIKP
jgi:O-antigen/teichoic acid export membrane protein